MNDGRAFGAMLAVAGSLLFCLACLLTLPYRVIWPIASSWLACCSMLMIQTGLPSSQNHLLTRLTAGMVGFLVSCMVGQGVVAVWRLWRGNQHLIHMSHLGHLSAPAVVTRLTNRLNLRDKLVMVSSQVPFSCCYGLRRPRICVSTSLIALLNEAEIEAVLHHEAYHLHRYEPLRMALAICLSRFFFFVPLLAQLRELYLAEKEFAADAAAIQAVGRTTLAGALYKLLTANQSAIVPSAVVVAGLSVTAQRVDRLISPGVKSAWRLSARSLLWTLGLFELGCLVMLIGSS